jgi:hypothetical protein
MPINQWNRSCAPPDSLLGGCMVQGVGCGRCIFETKLKQELRVTVIQSDHHFISDGHGDVVCVLLEDAADAA